MSYSLLTSNAPNSISQPQPSTSQSSTSQSSSPSLSRHVSDYPLSFSLDDMHQPNTNANMSSASVSASSSYAVAPPPPRSRTASLSQSATSSHLRASSNATSPAVNPLRQPHTPIAAKQTQRPDSVLYSSPSWAQTMPLPKLHDPLPTALPARASVMAQLPPVMRQLGFLGKNNSNGGSSSSDDDPQQDAVFTLDDTPEFRSTISLLEPEGLLGGDGDGGAFAVLNLDGLDAMYEDDDADAAHIHDRSTGSSSDATLVHAITPPALEPSADLASDHGGGHQVPYEGLSLALMQADEQPRRGRRSTPKPSNPPSQDAGNNRVSVVGDLPTFPRKGGHHHTRVPPGAPALSPTQESPPTPTRQEIHGNAAGGGTILGKLKRALSGRRTSPHSPSNLHTAAGAATSTPGDSDPASPSATLHHHHRSNSIDQGIGTLRRALSRATSSRRRKSPEDPPIPAPSSQAPNPYHNAAAAQQQQYQVSPYGTLLYNNTAHDQYQEYDTQPPQEHQFFSPPPEPTLGGLAGGGGDELYMATLARGDTESDRSVDHAEVSTNPFATLAGLPLTVPTRTDSRRTSAGALAWGISSSSHGGTGAGPEMALTPPELHEPVPAAFTLARPSAAVAAPRFADAPAVPPLTPTRVEEHATGYVTLQHSGRAQPVAPQATGDMLTQAMEVAAYQTMRRGGR